MKNFFRWLLFSLLWVLFGIPVFTFLVICVAVAAIVCVLTVGLLVLILLFASCVGLPIAVAGIEIEAFK